MGVSDVPLSDLSMSTDTGQGLASFTTAQWARLYSVFWDLVVVVVVVRPMVMFVLFELFLLLCFLRSPAISLGFTTLGQIFEYVTVFFF